MAWSFFSHSQAVFIISSMFVYLIFQPRMSFAFSLEAKRLSGSPSRLAPITTGTFFPVTRSADEIISFTEFPIPVPRFMHSLSEPESSFSSASL